MLCIVRIIQHQNFCYAWVIKNTDVRNSADWRMWSSSIPLYGKKCTLGLCESEKTVLGFFWTVIWHCLTNEKGGKDLPCGRLWAHGCYKKGHRWNVCVCVCVFLSAVPTAHGSFQARGWIRAPFAGLYHSHINARSELHLRPTPQLTAMPDS